MLVIAWGIAPFVGAVFNIETVTIPTPVLVITKGTLMNLEAQIDKMSGGIFNAAYSRVYLNATDLPFTTPEIAVLPFGVDQRVRLDTTDGLLTAETQAFQSNLICTPPEVKFPASLNRSTQCGNATYIDNQQGCRIKVPNDLSSTSGIATITYQSWYGALQGDSFEEQGCPCSKEYSNAFLANLWVNEIQRQSFLLCRTAYETFRVNATVRLLDNSLVSWQSLQPPQKLEMSQFNTSRFDRLLGLGMWMKFFPGLAQQDGMDFGNQDIINAFITGDQVTHGSALSPGIHTGRDLSEYAFYMDRRPIFDFMDPVNLAGALQAVHRLFFTLAISSVTSNITFPDTHREGIRHVEVAAVTVSPIFVLIAEAFLAISALFAIGYYMTNRKRSIRLLRDPHSILEIAALAGELHPASLLPCPKSSEKNHIEGFHKLRFHLSPPPTVQGARPSIVCNQALEPPNVCFSEHKDKQRRKRPFDIRTLPLAVFIVGLTSGLVTMTVLRGRIQHSNGLPVKQLSPFVRNLLLNYIPTLTGTFLEAVLVVINRTFCTMTPFERLRKGKASGKCSVAARLSNLPPQLTVFRAMAGAHFMLSGICLVALLANVLSVVLSGL